MKTCVIFNPVARGDKARRLQSRLTEMSQQAALKPTLCAGDARRLGAEAVREGFTTIVAAGGDGTLNEVLNGVGDEDGFAQSRLGVLPLGTVNVFAKEIGLPTTFDAAWATIQNGNESSIDLPWAEFTRDGVMQRRYFAQLAGAGLDSRAVELVNWELKKRLGFVSYVIAGVQALSEQLPRISVTNGAETAEGELVLIGNGRFYGGRFPMFPKADLRDGQLEAVVYPRVNIDAVARSCWGMVTDNFHSGGKTIQMRGARISLSSPRTIPFQLDGENIAPLPVTFGLFPQKLRVIVP